MSIPGYRSFEPLGSGGFGEVFRAVRASTGAQVAIKVLRDWTDQSAAWQQAAREFEALKNLKGHPHIISLEDVVVAGGVPHLVTEFAPGGSVHDLMVERTGALSVGEVVLIGQQTASALVFAHARGVIHLDIKPHNLLIGVDGQVLVCDFGIAALTAVERFRQQTNALALRYASPEQLDENSNVGTPSDVYSLGATIAHLLTVATGPADSGPMRGRQQGWALPAGVDPAVGERLGRLVMACTEPDPIGRPDAAAAEEEFEAIALALGAARCRKLPSIPQRFRHAGGASSSGPRPMWTGPRPPGPGVAMPPAVTGDRAIPRHRAHTTGGRRPPAAGAGRQVHRLGPSIGARRVRSVALLVLVIAGIVVAAALVMQDLLRRDPAIPPSTEAAAAVLASRRCRRSLSP